jgi:hypothetical protein
LSYISSQKAGNKAVIAAQDRLKKIPGPDIFIGHRAMWRNELPRPAAVPIDNRCYREGLAFTRIAYRQGGTSAREVSDV